MRKRFRHIWRFENLWHQIVYIFPGRAGRDQSKDLENVTKNMEQNRTMDLSHLNVVVWKVIGDSFVGVGPILRSVAVAVPGPGPAAALLPGPAGLPQPLPRGPGGAGGCEGVRVLVTRAGVDVLLQSARGVLASCSGGGLQTWDWKWENWGIGLSCLLMLIFLIRMSIFVIARHTSHWLKEGESRCEDLRAPEKRSFTFSQRWDGSIKRLPTEYLQQLIRNSVSKMTLLTTHVLISCPMLSYLTQWISKYQGIEIL